MCTFLGLQVKSAICDRTPPTCTSNLVYLCAGEFRGHKSSNRIEISWFIKFLLTFDWFQGSTPWGGRGGGRWMGWDSVRVFGGVLHAHVHAHMHTCMCAHVCTFAYMYKYDNFMQMAAPIGKSWGIPLWHHRSHACVQMCICVHVHMCVGHPPKYLDRVTPPSTHPHPPRGWTPEISQKSIKI